MLDEGLGGHWRSWDTEAIFFPKGFLVEASVAGGRSRQRSTLTGWDKQRVPSWAGPGPSAHRVGEVPRLRWAASNADPARATPSQARPHWALPQTLKQPRVRRHQRPLAGLAWLSMQCPFVSLVCIRLVVLGWFRVARLLTVTLATVTAVWGPGCVGGAGSHGKKWAEVRERAQLRSQLGLPCRGGCLAGGADSPR